jgi:rhodanese-related sulfurtransferase
MLYDSLRNKIMPLGDSVIVYPAHGAGSACGKNMSKETFDTLGHQKQVNYALRADLSKNDFIRELTTGIPTPPAYFPLNVQLNKQGYGALHEVLDRGTRKLSPSAFQLIAEEERALILDTRKPEVFAAGHIPGSINIGIDGGFAPWVGTLIPDIKQRLLLVADPGREQEVVTRLARVGYDHAMGYLDGGWDAWVAAGFDIAHIPSISVDEFARMKAEHPDYGILDVRKPGEYASEHLADAHLLTLDTLNGNLHQVNPNREYFVHCAGGYRSMIFASIMAARGYHRLINVEGGMAAIRKSGHFPLVTTACTSS